MNDPASVEQADVFAFLEDPHTHGLSEPVVRVDTHGAAVFLAGPDVYKVKRAVRFPYMDFSTLEKRRTACEAEISANLANAPDLYVGVVPITRDAAGLHIGGSGTVVEWAVHLRRFDETASLDRLADKAALGAELVGKIARAIFMAHQRAPVRDGVAATHALRCLLSETVDELHQTPDLFPGDNVGEFGRRLVSAFDRAEPLLLERAARDQVRRCHGDLHLGNIVLIDGEPILFDALEFNEAIATSDVLYDLAFPLMDLCKRGLRTDANQLLNGYLFLSDDMAFQIEGLAVLPLFLSLRAAIRAKVMAAQFHQSLKKTALRDTALAYFDAAVNFLSPAAPFLAAIGGLSGTGKSSLAAALAPEIGLAPGALHLRSDIERKRISGVSQETRLSTESYRAQMTAEVYANLNEFAAAGLRAGRAVILDATFLRPEDRTAAQAIAASAGVAFAGFWLDAPVDLLVRRVAQRVGDASDATPAVVVAQTKAELGAITWHRLDASQQLPNLKHAALEFIIANQPHTRPPKE
ncbi:MAG: AAA family ATPase [Castellaniella sp.]|nr:AAA family ATPase [Castellaniella sp.]